MLRTEMRKTYTLPPTRVLSQWTPSAVRNALRDLQMGNFDRAAYLWDAIMGDDRATAVMSTRVNGLLGCPLDFEPGSLKRIAKKVSETLELDYWDICPESQMDALMSYGRGLGVALAELRWSRRDSRVVPSLYIWHPSHIRYDEFRDTWHVMTREGETQIEPNGGKWVLYRPYGSQFAGARTLVRALAIPWLVKTYAIQDWARHSEKLAGVIKGKTPPQVTDDQRDEFVGDLANLGNSGVVILPEGWDAELLEASAHSYEAFEKLISWANTAMAVAVLGQNLATETTGGSLAAAKAQELVRQDYKQADAEGIATLLHDGVFEHWTRLNFGDVTLTPWATYNTIPETEQMADAETLLTQADALSKLKALGAGVDVSAMLERFDIPWSRVETLPPPVEPQPPVTEDGDAGELEPGDIPGEDEQPVTQSVTLASNDNAVGAAGFVTGQLYVDSLGDVAAKQGAAVFAGYTQQVLATIASAQDYDDLRRKLRNLYRDSEPSEFAQLIERALILSAMAGQLAVRDDAPEVNTVGS